MKPSQHFDPTSGRSTGVVSAFVHSQGGVGQLLLGEVERVIEHGDAVAAGVLLGRQAAPQEGVVGNVEEGHHAVPCLVVEPHLPRWR